jgi:hypothetical protein
MKEHAKKALKHDVEVLGKTVPTIAVLALFLIGSGSAAVLTEFGTVTGTADVDNQALTVSNTDSSQTYNGDAAPLTDGTVVEITNNNENRFVDYEWAIRESDNFEDKKNAYREVYEVQEFEAVPSQASNPDQRENIDVTVKPNVDQVEYTLDLPDTEGVDNYNGGDIDLEVSRESDDPFHVKFRHPNGDFSNREWGIKDPSSGSLTTYDSASELENNHAEVRSVSASDNGDGEADQITIVLERNMGYDQTFGINAHAESQGSTPSDNTNWATQLDDGTYFSYTKKGTHLSPDFTDHLGTEATVSPSGTQEYNVGVFLDSSTDPEDSFDLNVGVDPVTAGQ